MIRPTPGYRSCVSFVVAVIALAIIGIAIYGVITL